MAKHSTAKYHGVEGEFPNQCEGSVKNGTRRCRRKAIAGSNICLMHGAGAPQVKASARQRLALLVNPSIAKIASFVNAKKNDRNISPQLQLAAARDVLDRNGLKPKDELVVHAEFDASRFKDWTEEEIEQFIALARRASTQRDVTDAPLETAEE